MQASPHTAAAALSRSSTRIRPSASIDLASNSSTRAPATSGRSGGGVSERELRLVIAAEYPRPEWRRRNDELQQHPDRVRERAAPLRVLHEALRQAPV